MPVARFQMPDGRVARFDVPEGTTPEQAHSMMEAHFGNAPEAGVSAPAKEPAAQGSRARAQAQSANTLSDTLKAGAEGLVSGAADIGNTILTPVRAGMNAIAPKQQTLSGLVTGEAPKRQGVLGSVADYFDEMKAAPDKQAAMNADHPIAFGVGRTGAQVAMTAPVGGAIAQGLGKIPMVAKVAPNLLRAIETSGMSAGTAAPGWQGTALNLLTRSTGGAITGGAAAGLIDPSQASTGAALGAALPPALMAAGKVGSLIGQGARSLTKNTLGLTTGVGSEPISQAYKAGKAGNQAFLENMRGDVPLTDVLDQAKAGLQAMNAAKTAEYRSGMIPIKGDQSVLSLNGISKAVDDATAITTFKGQVKNEAANTAVEKMRSVVDEWKSLDPAQFHTPEGLDALKQKLGGILEGIPFEEKTARTAASKVYNATKAEIEAQAPTYAKVMKGYQAASDQISEIERALSLGKKASNDTAMRKLQSLMRNNVQTNYGNRLTLANALEDKGGVDLLPSLAGQALNSVTPRSLSGQIGSGVAMYGALSNPLTLAALPTQSPRLVGELAYGAGRIAGKAGNALNQSAGQGNMLAQLLNDPSPIAQFGYRAAPAVMAGR